MSQGHLCQRCHSHAKNHGEIWVKVMPHTYTRKSMYRQYACGLLCTLKDKTQAKSWRWSAASCRSQNQVIYLFTLLWPFKVPNSRRFCASIFIVNQWNSNNTSFIWEDAVTWLLSPLCTQYLNTYTDTATCLCILSNHCSNCINNIHFNTKPLDLFIGLNTLSTSILCPYIIFSLVFQWFYQK